MDVTDILPLIVPSEYFSSGAFAAPHRQLVHPDLTLTWVVLTEGGTMRYLPAALADNWEAQGLDWEAQAIQNLVRSGDLITHEKRNASGALVFVAMMHEDGLGSSRTLLHMELGKLFPEGYNIAIPDRSLALVFPSTVSASELAEIQALIQQCYEDANTPMLKEILSPHDVQTVRLSSN